MAEPSKPLRRTKQPQLTYQPAAEPDQEQINAVFNRLFELVLAQQQPKSNLTSKE